MKITQDFIPVGRANRPGRVNNMLYVTIHNSGNANKGANAEMHSRYVQSEAAESAMVSWHYSVDEFGAYQHLPDNEDGFHAGDGAGQGNRQSIGIEICMNSDGDLLAATNNAAELTAELGKKHNIPIERVVQHNHWSGKNCPQMLRAGKPYNWEAFVKKVLEFMKGNGENEMRYDFVKDLPTWAQGTVKKMMAKGYIANEDGKLNLSEDMLRLLVFNDRAGVYKG